MGEVKKFYVNDYETDYANGKRGLVLAVKAADYATLEAENAKLRAELERRVVPDALLAEARMVISSMLDECEHDFPLELKWMAERASKGRRIYEDDRALAAPSAPKADDPVKVQSDAHPMQPVVIAPDGVIRFKENRIVSHLLDFATPLGCSMNELACEDFSQEDRMQFAQLIGYSVGGYGDLSYASRESVEAADVLAEQLDAIAAARQEGGK